MATIAILGAIESRHRTGRGQSTEVSLHDIGLHMLAAIASNHLISGEPATRYGNAHPNIVPYRTFQTSDGVLAVGVGNDVQFRAFAEIVGCPEWAEDERFARNQDRVRNRELMEQLITDRIATRTKAEWMDEFARAGIPNGPVNSVAEALASPHAAARGMVVEVEHPTIGAFRSLGLPIRLTETPARIHRPPPLLGEHTDEVLAELGYDEGAVAALHADGVV